MHFNRMRTWQDFKQCYQDQTGTGQTNQSDRFWGFSRQNQTLKPEMTVPYKTSLSTHTLHLIDFVVLSLWITWQVFGFIQDHSCLIIWTASWADLGWSLLGVGCRDSESRIWQWRPILDVIGPTSTAKGSKHCCWNFRPRRIESQSRVYSCIGCRGWGFRWLSYD